MLYEVVRETNIDLLENEVNKRLKEGWHLAGGVTVIENPEGRGFLQAVYKKPNPYPRGGPGAC